MQIQISMRTICSDSGAKRDGVKTYSARPLEGIARARKRGLSAIDVKRGGLNKQKQRQMT